MINTYFFPQSGKSGTSTSRSTSGSEPLTDQQAIEWTGPIIVGGQNFIIDFDTGSSDLWVPSVHCKTNCGGKHKYNPAKSKTSKHLNGNFTIKYGDGSTVEGSEYSDTVSVGEIEVTGQHLAAADVLSSMFQGSPEDG